MVGFKENIIKLTDYLFTYSVLGSLFVIFFKKNISLVNTPFNEYIPVLIFIGIIGTIISIIDPFGRLAKLIIIIVANYKYALKTRYNSSQPVILERKFQHLYEFFIKRFGLSEMVEEKREKKEKERKKRGPMV